ncbi:hypothetical protein SAY86_024146 [Trapa natans]|uniref:1-phosphatidylinositol 4-kinase n=1 Tax=Trapa natans TaxID=22666 RepID=A0AAN7RAX3_TRANT|nr:hypothetical protein SAY86_024146 [Trapa natans]
MSHELDSPVQIQMAVAVFRSPLRKSRGNDGHEGRQFTGRRRVFVQTETGCVLDMELDRNDNVHTVKRRLQVAFNVPTDESSLSFGDMVLKNDLSAVRHDSPLLLTRNVMHRSLSTPCLSPSGRDLHKNAKSGPIEILGQSDRLSRVKPLMEEIVKAIKKGVDPVPVNGGLGGAYYFRNCRGEHIAIVKPTDEEPYAPNNPKGFIGKALGRPGLKRSVRVGETGFREVAAYLLDYAHFANVPPTALVKITHSIFNVNDGMSPINPFKNSVSKIASLQQFILHDFDASDHGTSSFPVTAVHRIGILDIRIFNTDRHAGNLLVRKLCTGRFDQVELIPIDHGLCLPETLEDPYFEWIHWPQASIPFSDDELEYIKELDPVRDCEMLRAELPMIREACLRILYLCTIFLKEASAYGLCLAEIGEMMSRGFRNGDEEPSELELVCIEVRRSLMRSKADDIGEQEFQFDMDCGGTELDNFPKVAMEDYAKKARFHFGIGGRNPLSKLDEVIKEEVEEESEGEEEGKGNVCASSRPFFERIPSVSKLSSSLKNMTLGKKTSNVTMFSVTNNQEDNSSLGHQSANEQPPASVRFVKLADMNEEEWGLFLGKFQELIYPVFANRKFITLGQKLTQRLGTSCKF